MQIDVAQGLQALQTLDKRVTVDVEAVGGAREVAGALQVGLQRIEQLCTLAVIVASDAPDLFLIHIAQVIHACDLVEVTINTQVVEVRDAPLAIEVLAPRQGPADSRRLWRRCCRSRWREKCYFRHASAAPDRVASFSNVCRSGLC